MSILIKEIDLPKCCDDCEFMQSGYPDWCDLTCRGLDVFNPSIRPNWCPLVEVKTPHGRLIDADELLKEIAELKRSPWYNCENRLHHILYAEAIDIIESLCITKSLTVIEAEEEEE